MRTPRLAWAGRIPAGPGEEIWLDPGQSRHALTVLRLSPGRPVEVAGPAGLARALVTTADLGRRGRPPRLGLTLAEAWREPEIPPGPRLALALIPGPRFDWAVEKAAELGAGELCPLLCERTKPGLARAAAARAGRWQRLADEARKQCGRARPLIINPPRALSELLTRPGPGFFLSPAVSGPAGGPAEGAPATPLLVVGPEGGLSPGEERDCLRAGLKPWRLGALPTLRTETAALAALAVMMERRPAVLTNSNPSRSQAP